MSINGWMVKEDTIYIHNVILFSHKEKWNEWNWRASCFMNQASLAKTNISCFTHMWNIEHEIKRGLTRDVEGKKWKTGRGK
jgi:hypothetical protein